MPEIAFYHLTRRPLDRVLPSLIETSLARGWRVAVQAATDRRLAELDAHLWSYKPEAFLPHGTKKDGAPQEQPVYLTIDDDNPNSADVRFFLEGARAAPVLADPLSAPKERAVILFEEADREPAREQWKELLSSGQKLAYWQENEDGKFVLKMEKNG